MFLLVLVAALERFGLWASDRSRLPWRRENEGTPVSAAGFEKLDAFMGAGKRHELDQRNHSLRWPRGRRCQVVMKPDMDEVEFTKPSRDQDP